MSNEDQEKRDFREKLALYVLIAALIAMTLLAWAAIGTGGANAKDVLTMILPVLASWVGTVIAFYFGSKNFEAASEQARELMGKLGAEERSQHSVTAIMRPLGEMGIIKLDNDASLDTLTIKSILERMVDHKSRIPLLSPKGYPLYMVHSSSIDRFVSEGGKKDATLKKFLEQMEKFGLKYGPDDGFITISSSASIAQAREKLDQHRSAQDIFITKTGSSDEPLLGWISNTRLLKFIDK